MKQSNVSVILAAAGQSSRYGDPNTKKVFALANDRAVWLHSLDKFAAHDRVREILVVIDPSDAEVFQDKFGAAVAMFGLKVILGGIERRDSVRNALSKVDPTCDLVAIHDAARPCFTVQLFDQVIAAAEEHKAAIPACGIHGTVKKVDANRRIIQTVSREALWIAQTPQIFDRKLLCNAYEKSMRESTATDDAQMVEEFGHAVFVVEGEPTNIKITTRKDLSFAESALKIRTKSAFPFV